MEDNKWTKQIMTRSLGARYQGWPEVKWEKEVERVMKQRNSTAGDITNRQLWQLKTGNWWITRKLIYRYL
jgi:hypothetical protein